MLVSPRQPTSSQVWPDMENDQTGTKTDGSRYIFTSGAGYQVIKHLLSFFSQIIGHGLRLTQELVNGHVGLVVLPLRHAGLLPVQGGGGRAVDLNGDVGRVGVVVPGILASLAVLRYTIRLTEIGHSSQYNVYRQAQVKTPPAICELRSIKNVN